MENVMQIPKLAEINLNTGVGKGAVIDRKQLIGAVFTLEVVSGQKPSITRAKKTIDKFKLRQRMMIGCKVTLRKKRMFFFLQSLLLLLSNESSTDFITGPLLSAPHALPGPSSKMRGGGPREGRLPVGIRGAKGRQGRKVGSVCCAFGIENIQGAFKHAWPQSGSVPIGDGGHGMDVQLQMSPMCPRRGHGGGTRDITDSLQMPRA